MNKNEQKQLADSGYTLDSLLEQLKFLEKIRKSQGRKIESKAKTVKTLDRKLYEANSRVKNLEASCTNKDTIMTAMEAAHQKQLDMKDDLLAMKSDRLTELSKMLGSANDKAELATKRLDACLVVIEVYNDKDEL